MPRRALHAAFVQAFARNDVEVDHIRAICVRHGWTRRVAWRRSAPDNDAPLKLTRSKTEERRSARERLAELKSTSTKSFQLAVDSERSVSRNDTLRISERPKKVRGWPLGRRRRCTRTMRACSIDCPRRTRAASPIPWRRSGGTRALGDGLDTGASADERACFPMRQILRGGPG